MFMIRSRFIFGALASVLALGACSKDAPKPQPTPETLLQAHEWRLTETRVNGQVTGSGAAVKDQYDWHFVAGGGYHRKFVVDGTTEPGQWQLPSNSSLRTIDHKGNVHGYTVQQLDDTTLKLRWEEHAGEVHDDIYTAR